MHTWTCTQPGYLTHVECPNPILQPGQVLLRPLQVGICGTDIHAFAGQQPYFSYPRILGHEVVAAVVAADEAAGLVEDDPVVVIPYVHCGTCVTCRQGRTNCCIQLNVIGVHSDGAMRDLFTHPASLLIPAGGLSLDAMTIVEPLAIGNHAVLRSQVRPGQWVVVSGCGPIGVGILWAAARQGARTIAIDTDAQRLQFCLKHLGVTVVVPAGDGAATNVLECTGGDNADVVFDATGLKPVMEAAVQYVAAGGCYVLVGLTRNALSFEHPYLHARELSILCSRNAVRADFEAVMAGLAEEGSFPVAQYITHRMSNDVESVKEGLRVCPGEFRMKGVVCW